MVFLLALAAGSAHAQAHEISAWTAVLAAPDLTGRTRAWFDLHLRREEDRFWMIVRPGLGLQLTDAISAWGGYDFIPSIPDDGEASVEHRISRDELEINWVIVANWFPPR